MRLKLRRVHSLLQILDLKIKRPAKYISHGTSRASGSDAASRKVSSIRERAGDCIDGTGISMSVLPLTPPFVNATVCLSKILHRLRLSLLNRSPGLEQVQRILQGHHDLRSCDPFYISHDQHTSAHLCRLRICCAKPSNRGGV